MGDKRKRTFPRFEGMLLIHDAHTLRQVELRDMDRSTLKQLYHDLTEMLGIAQRWFKIDTGRDIEIKKTDDGWKWCVADTRMNSMHFKWLSSKAKRYEQLILRRVNSRYARTGLEEPAEEGRPD